MEISLHKITVRPNHIKAGGTDNSRFENDNALEESGLVESMAYLDPSLLAEVIELLEQDK